MEMLTIVLFSAVILTIAYFTYGRWLARMFRLDDRTPTPAITMQDDVDYVPCQTGPLLSQHFSAITATGSIVGPILAGLYFGWLPALLWILIGSILVGGVHNSSALVTLIRHKASSILEVVRIHISGRAYQLFLTFVWLALVLIVAAFTDVTASMFVGALGVEHGTPFKSMAAANAAENAGTLVLSGGIATSSLIYLALTMIMGLLVRSRVMSMGAATWIFLPLVGVSIWVGQYIPLNVDQIMMWINPNLTPDESVLYAVRSWDVFLLAYCAIASVVPMWLLQPRGQLSRFFLYAALGAGALGILLGGQPIEQPMFKGFIQEKGSLFPFLFITIACGAYSGFHLLFASGTTSKQSKVESNARHIGYGAIMLEAMVATVSLCCVMMLPKGSQLLSSDPSPNLIFANGIGTFLGKINVPTAFGVAFAFMAFNTFVYDTLDVCTRLGRLIIQELTGWKNRFGMWFGTLLTVGAPMIFVLQRITDANGKTVPVWKVFWSLFGASSQLLAALTLLGVTVWLWRTRQAVWVFFVTGIPAVFMYVMSSWALVTIVQLQFAKGGNADPVAWIAVVLLILAALMPLEGIAALFRHDAAPGNKFGMRFGTLLTIGVPMIFVLQRITQSDGQTVPVWKFFSSHFGASNQLLAALTLLGVTVWMWRTRQAVWVFFVTGIPAVLMCVMPLWSLTTVVQQQSATQGNADPVASIFHPVFADLSNKGAKGSPFDVVLQRVAETTTSNDWTKDDWADMQLKSSLSALLDRLQEITKQKNLELPVKFDSVRPAISPDGSNIDNLRNALFVTKRGKVTNADNSIILADESIEVSYASNSLIIARGTVDVSYGSGNLIIAGYFAQTSRVGSSFLPLKFADSHGSVLIAGAVVDVSHANDTIVCAPLAARITDSTNGIFVNSPNRNISYESNSTYLTDDSQTLPTLFAEHPHFAKLKVTRIVPQDGSGNGAFVASINAGVETAIQLGQDIPNATGELKGWKLVFVGRGFALFAKDDQYAGVYIAPRD